MSRYSNRWFTWRHVVPVAMAAIVGFGTSGCRSPGTREIELAPPTEEIAFGSGICDREDAFEAGKTAAERAKAKIGDAPVKAVIVSECFEDKDRKSRVLDGICSVFDKAVVFGGSTYGSFNESGVVVGESVGVMAIAGKGIDVHAACQTDLGTSKLTPAEHEAHIKEKLTPAGAALAKMLPVTDKSRLMVVIADAHSPKNAPLVEGIQTVSGDAFPIVGGCANKNAGQTFIYYRGEMFTDAAVGLMLSGEFEVALAGRQAKENDKVIATARESASEALEGLNARPAAMLAFDCAGRKGKLDNVSDELAAIQSAVGMQLPLFGSYNAGEIGPADLAAENRKPDVLSSGVGWHVMIAVMGW